MPVLKQPTCSCRACHSIVSFQRPLSRQPGKVTETFYKRWACVPDRCKTIYHCSKPAQRCSAQGEGYASSAESRRELEKAEKWSSATVVENKAVSVDGNMRTLVLSIEDKVTYLEGRTMHRKQERPRWVDAYTVPGQFVAIRVSADSAQTAIASSSSGDNLAPEAEGAAGPHLFAIASSPYAARRESADLDASIIEVLVDRQGSKQEQSLAGLGPGHLLEVSNVMGRGYASLWNSYVGLMSALEESRNLLLIGMGSRGIAPLRAVLEWTPVQAHATAHRVTLLYVAPAATGAAFIKDWDQWRQAGVVVEPLYVETNNSTGNGSQSSKETFNTLVQERLVESIFGREQGLMGTVGGDPRDAAVLMSGLPGSIAAAVSRRMTAEGIERERVLFCDYV